MQKDLPRPVDKGIKPAKPLLLIGEASELLGVSIDTIRRWDAAGKIQTIRTPGRTRLIPREEVERLKNGIKTTPEKLPEVKEPTAPQIPTPIAISKPTEPTPSVGPVIPPPQPIIEPTPTVPVIPIPVTLPVETRAAVTSSTESKKLHQKIINGIRFYRPVWYERWHAHPASRPTHLAILGVVLIAAASLFVYQWFIVPAAEEQKERLKELGDVLAAATPPRILSFQGRLTDENGVPETGATNIRFRIWDQLSGGTEGDCSGFDEDCLWRSAVRSVDPDQNGIFSVTLGDTGPGDPAIPSTLFSDYAELYLGVTAGADSEMTPRQRIASVSYALNSDSLDGIDSLSFLRSDTSDTFSGGTLTLTFAGTQNLATTSDLAGNVNVISLIGTPSGSAGTAQGLFIQQADSANSNGLDAALVIDNADTNLAITDAILITATGAGTYGDYIDAPNFDVTNAGSVTAVGVNAGTGLLQGSLGLTITGAAVSLNASSNFDTNINTGTSTGTITIGNSTSTNIKLGKFTTDNGVLYISETDGTISETAASTEAQCLQTAGAGTAPIWGTCGSFSGEVDDTTNDSLTFSNDDATPPAGTVDAIFRDNTGDLNINTISGKTLNLQIAGADEYNFSSSSVNLNTNILENIGNTNTDFIATTGALTLAGVLTANGGIDMGTNTISGTTAVINFDDFDVDADGLTTIAPDGSGVALQINLPNNTTQGIVIDASTVANTGTSGVIDLNVNSATSGNIGLNIDYTGVGAGGTAQTLKGFNFDYTIADDNDGTDTFYAMEIDIHRANSDGSDDTGDTQYGLYIHDNNDTDTYNIDALLVVETKESSGQTPDDLIRLVPGAVVIVADAIDASSANILNALNAGNNFIFLGTAAAGSNIQMWSTGANNFTIEDDSGNDLLTVTDNANVGDLNITGVYKNGGTSGTSVTCSGGQFLQNQVVSGGITTGGTCASAGGGAPDTARFYDNTTEAAVDGDGTDYWNGTYPNITPDSTSNTVLISAALTWTAGGAADIVVSYRLVREDDGGSTTPSCDGSDPEVGQGTVGGFGGFTTANAWINGGSVTLLAVPNSTSATYFTVCSSGNSNLGSAATISEIEVALVELGADLAESYYTNDDSIAAGHIVSMDATIPAGAKKSAKLYDPQMLGVVSTAPGWTLDDAIGLGFGRSVPVALVGRVPVKVNGENGPIVVGDLITSSSTPGVGMKATKAGYVIGRAMTAFSGEGEGVVLAFVNTHYANPTKLDYDGSLQDELGGGSTPLGVEPLISLDKESNLVATVSANAKFVWTNSLGKAVALLAEAGEAVFEKIEVLAAEIRKLIIKDEMIIAKEAEISGTSRFEPGDQEVEIQTEKIAPDSLIYLTPTTRTDGLVLYVKEKTEGKGFTVGLDVSDELTDLLGKPKETTPSASRAIEFNWLLINQE